MTSTLLDVVVLLDVALAAGGAGWFLRDVVEQRRMRRVIADTLGHLDRAGASSP